jgi:hypothetical protein
MSRTDLTAIPHRRAQCGDHGPSRRRENVPG